VSFHQEAVTPACLAGLAFLRPQPYIQKFYLAGGTALALQIGHRISTDLDWFSALNPLTSRERGEIQHFLKGVEDFEVVDEQDGLLFTRLLGTDISFIYQHHPLLEPSIDFDGVALASPIDIGLMKLAAINSRGTRRDFVDLFFLQDHASLDRLFDLVPKKYPDKPSFLAIAGRALTYFDDAENQPMPKMLARVKWEDVKAYCWDSVRKLTRRSSGLA